MEKNNHQYLFPNGSQRLLQSLYLPKLLLPGERLTNSKNTTILNNLLLALIGSQLIHFKHKASIQVVPPFGCINLGRFHLHQLQLHQQPSYLHLHHLRKFGSPNGIECHQLTHERGVKQSFCINTNFIYNKQSFPTFDVNKPSTTSFPKIIVITRAYSSNLRLGEYFCTSTP